MISREEIFEALLGDDNITEALLELSAAYRKDNLRAAFAPYYRLCAVVSEQVDKLDLPGKNSPPEAVGLGKMVPFVAIALPGFGQGFVETWADSYLALQGEDLMFYNDVATEANEQGEAGEANYVHGLLACAAVADAMMQMMGAQLLMAAAVNLEPVANGDSGSAGAH
jgi:hypothetical protein